ncbi:unnamed protein product [Parajaminaea phylloscopi]
MADFVPPPVFTSGARTAASSSLPSSSRDAGVEVADASAHPAQSGTKVTTHNQYHTAGLDTSDLLPSPLALFQKWFDEALGGGKVNEPEAMLLSTVQTASGGVPKPSSRVVLLKSVHPTEGLTFYTNHGSRKGRELEGDPWCSAVFYWRETHQSVRFVGRAHQVSRAESQEYFDSRPIGSRIGAWASPQSQVIRGGREELEGLVAKREEEFGVPGAAKDQYQGQDKKIPVPGHWGGYRIQPYEVEFWVGRPNRLHDRFRYTRSDQSDKLPGEDQWLIERLAP